ncbi:hypothetical protein KJK34_14200 [Flavobacterium sp. D11R37]|uniref:hypothetical protein n=1 Tax=Flavobacterium coralii TaxID=2838017 RepID=UPI001CA713F6|nr:hypothetical protein [Flavobacterium coralii]MBY8963908.1 hypothetical protein [Flavobacterium coralii]
MFQLFKKRNFNNIFNDTFTFFRVAGKNYFSNYIKIAGGFLLVLVVLMYLGAKVFFEGLFTRFTNPQQDQLLESYFYDNTGFFIATAIFCGILILVLSAINYAFPVVYLRIMETKPSPTTGELVSGIKKSFGRVIIFSLLSLITFLPIAAILGVICVLLIMILIGIPVALFVFAFISCWVFQSFYDYLNNNNGFFTSMRNGYNNVFSNFWAHTGSTAIFIIILYVVQTITSLIPYIIGGFLTLTEIQGPEDQADALSTMGVLMLVSFLISSVVGYLLTNVLLINQGMIYYSSRENIENNSLHSDIDLIGTDIE